MRYSAHSRLQAQLASMPVIKQAKSIVMAQCGSPAHQAFDAPRRAWQQENIKVWDLAAQIVAKRPNWAPLSRTPTIGGEPAYATPDERGGAGRAARRGIPSPIRPGSGLR